MNGMDKITARIETEAVADAARMAEDAAVQCRAVRAEGEAKAQECYWRKVKDGVKAAEDRAERLAKAADMEARKSILACKQAIVGETFDRAEAKLRALAGDEYIDFLAGQAARAAVTGREEIVLSEKDKASIGDKVAKKANDLLRAEGKDAGLVLAAEAGSFSGGLLLKDGNITVNCTLEALMAQAREEQAAAVAAELFS